MAEFANASMCRDVGEHGGEFNEIELCWVLMDSNALHKWLGKLSTLVDTGKNEQDV